MRPLNLNNIVDFVAKNIGSFHQRRIESLQRLKLNQILKRKNPYLFKAKDIHTAHELVKSLLDAHLSSQEETIFGDLLEALAIFVCAQVFDGKKSAAEGIDLEFERDGKWYIVSIKSGPNWGNSSQIKRMVENFKKARRILNTSGNSKPIVAVNGCCYGKENQPDKDDYLKLCGQDFWELISGNDKLYIEIIEPLGHQAKQHNETFQKEYARLINIFTQEFLQEFCVSGQIDWPKLIQFNSGRPR